MAKADVSTTIKRPVEDVFAVLSNPETFMSKFETGERSLDVIEVSAVCRSLGVPIHDFINQLEKRLAG